jgi:hypothetical protein
MRFFALETNLEKLKSSFASPGEQLLLTVPYSRFSFFFSILKLALFTIVLLAIGIGSNFYANLPLAWISGAFFIVWTLFVPFQLLKKYIHWKFSFLQLTSSKVVIVDQSTVFSRNITQMNLETFVSVRDETQWANMFPFGSLHFNFKEGASEEVVMKFIPHAEEVAEKIADVVAEFQRRKNVHIMEGEKTATEPLPAFVSP